MTDFDGGIGLCVCLNDSEACCNCLLGTFCPCCMYAHNYQTAGGQSFFLPCCCHMVADCAVSGAASSGPAGVAQPIHVPLGCVLRANHRQAIAKNGNENYIESILVETLCWGCSMAQISKYLKQNQQKFEPSNTVFGFIKQKNSMTGE